MIETLPEAYKAAIQDINGEQQFEITRQVYIDALECLPPIYGYESGEFWVGEPYNDDENGNPTALQCWIEAKDSFSGKQYYCRLSTIKGRGR